MVSEVLYFARAVGDVDRFFVRAYEALLPDEPEPITVEDVERAHVRAEAHRQEINRALETFKFGVLALQAGSSVKDDFVPSPVRRYVQQLRLAEIREASGSTVARAHRPGRRQIPSFATA